jgi:hypothetical protein
MCYPMASDFSLPDVFLLYFEVSVVPNCDIPRGSDDTASARSFPFLSSHGLWFENRLGRLVQLATFLRKLGGR